MSKLKKVTKAIGKNKKKIPSEAQTLRQISANDEDNEDFLNQDFEQEDIPQIQQIQPKVQVSQANKKQSNIKTLLSINQQELIKQSLQNIPFKTRISKLLKDMKNNNQDIENPIYYQQLIVAKSYRKLKTSVLKLQRMRKMPLGVSQSVNLAKKLKKINTLLNALQNNVGILRNLTAQKKQALQQKYTQMRAQLSSQFPSQLPQAQFLATKVNGKYPTLAKKRVKKNL